MCAQITSAFPRRLVNVFFWLHTDSARANWAVLPSGAQQEVVSFPRFGGAGLKLALFCNFKRNPLDIEPGPSCSQAHMVQGYDTLTVLLAPFGRQGSCTPKGGARQARGWSRGRATQPEPTVRASHSRKSPNQPPRAPCGQIYGGCAMPWSLEGLHGVPL